MNRSKFSQEERARLVAAVDNDRTNGLTVPEALKKHKVSKPAYYSWKVSPKNPAKYNKKKRVQQPKLLNIILPNQDTPFIFVMGRMTDVSAVMGQLNQLTNRG